MAENAESSILFKIAVDSGAATAEWKQTTQAMAGGLKTVETGLGSVSKATQQMSAAGASATEQLRQSYRDAARALKDRLRDEARAEREVAKDHRNAQLAEVREAERNAEKRRQIEERLQRYLSNLAERETAGKGETKKGAAMREELQRQLAHYQKLEAATSKALGRRAEIESQYAERVKQINSALSSAQINIERQKNQALETLTEKRTRGAKESAKATDSATVAAGVFRGELAKELVWAGLEQAIGLTKEMLGQVVELSRKTAEYARSQRFLQEQFGLTGEEAAALTFILKDAGDVQDGLGQLRQNIVDAASGSEQAAEKFALLDIQFKNADGTARKVAAVLRDIVEASKGTLTEEQRNAISSWFGEDVGKKLTPLIARLDEFKQKAREAGLVMSEDAARRAEEFAQRSAELEMRLEGLSVILGSKLIPVVESALPPIERTVKEFSAWIDRNQDLFNSLKVIGEFLGVVIAVSVQSLARALSFLSGEIEVVSLAVVALGKAFSGDLAGARVALDLAGQKFSSVMSELKKGFGETAGASKEFSGQMQIVSQKTQGAARSFAQLRAELKRVEDQQKAVSDEMRNTVDAQTLAVQKLVAAGQLSEVGAAAESLRLAESTGRRKIEAARSVFNAEAALILKGTQGETEKNQQLSAAYSKYEAVKIEAAKDTFAKEQALREAQFQDEQRYFQKSKTARDLEYEERLNQLMKIGFSQQEAEQQLFYLKTQNIRAELSGLDMLILSKSQEAGKEMEVLELKRQRAALNRELISLEMGIGNAAAGAAGAAKQLGQVARETMQAVGKSFDPENLDSLNEALEQVIQNVWVLKSMGGTGVLGGIFDYYSLQKYLDEFERITGLIDALKKKQAAEDRTRRLEEQRRAQDEARAAYESYTDEKTRIDESYSETLRKIEKSRRESERNYERDRLAIATRTKTELEKLEAELSKRITDEAEKTAFERRRIAIETTQALKDIEYGAQRDLLSRRAGFIVEESNLKRQLAEAQAKAKGGDAGAVEEAKSIQAELSALAEKKRIEEKRRNDIERAEASGKSKEEIELEVKTINEKADLELEYQEQRLALIRNGDTAALRELETNFRNQLRFADDYYKSQLQYLRDKNQLEEDERASAKAKEDAEWQERRDDILGRQQTELADLKTKYDNEKSERDKALKQAERDHDASLTALETRTAEAFSKMSALAQKYFNDLKAGIASIGSIPAPGGAGQPGSAGTDDKPGGSGGSTIRTNDDAGGKKSSGSSPGGDGNKGNSQRKPPAPPPPPKPAPPPAPSAGKTDFAEVGQNPFGQPQDQTDKFFNKDARPMLAQVVNLLRKGDQTGARDVFGVLRRLFAQRESSLTPEFARAVSRTLEAYEKKLKEAEVQPDGGESGGQQIVQDHAPPDKFGEPPPGPTDTGQTINDRPGGPTATGTDTKPTPDKPGGKPAPKPYDNATEYQTIPGPAQPILAHLSNKEIDQAEAERQWKALIAQNDALGRYDKVVMARIKELGSRLTPTGGGAGDIVRPASALSAQAVQLATAGGGLGNPNALRTAAQQSIARSVPDGPGAGASGVIPKRAAEAVKQAGGKGGDVNMIIEALPDYDETERRVLKKLKEAHEAIYGRR